MPVLPIEDTAGEPRDWAAVFPPEEYRARLHAVCAEMERCGVDTLFVSSPANIVYLTGYDSRWFRRSTPTGLAIRRDTQALIFFDDVSHRSLVSHGPGVIAKSAFFSRFRDTLREGWIYRNTVDDIADTLKDLGWHRGTTAVEHWALAPAGLVLRALEQHMEDAGARTVDGSWIVDRVRLVKSPREIALIEQAGAIADAAFLALKSELRAGMTETEIQGFLNYQLSRRGGEEPAIRTGVASGSRTLSHHTVPTQRKVQKGDLILIDICGSIQRYHCCVQRTFAVGEPDRRWIEFVDKAKPAIRHVIAAMRPGDPMEKTIEVARAYLESVGLAQYGWFIGGYDLGIAVPPDWVGHTYLNGKCFERADFKIGTVTTYEHLFDVPQFGWPGGESVAFNDTIVMGEEGLRVISRLDQGIVVGDNG